MRKRLWVEKQKGPDPFGVRACSVQRFEGARLRASLSRMHSVLTPIKLSDLPRGKSLAGRIGRMHGGAARTQRLHRRGTGERDRTLYGPAGSDGVGGIHDGVLGRSALTRSGLEYDEVDCK
jgi:hypothetical protein